MLVPLSILGVAVAEPAKKLPTKETCSTDVDQSGDYDFELVSPRRSPQTRPLVDI